MKDKPPDLKVMLEFALEAAWQAGQTTLARFNTGVSVEQKADNTPVTEADRVAEETIRTLITQYWPEHNIVGEEKGRKVGQSAYTWIIDPIDGTKSFVSGVPLFATLLALTDGENGLLGVAHFPALGETLYAMRGGGCYWNGRRTRVSSVSRLSDAVLLTSGLNYFGKRSAAWQRLVEKTYIQRTWGDAYGYFLVATGRAEIMVDPAMSLWDCAPFQVIMTEAGGTFTDWRGKPVFQADETLGTNGRLLPQVLAEIRGD